jgi:hypothetical protein
MTQDEISELARKAGLFGRFMYEHKDEIEVFAKLVAAKEREECADLLEFGYIEDEGHHLQYAKEIRARGEQA